MSNDANVVLDFEKKIVEIEERIKTVTALAKDSDVNIDKELNRLQLKLEKQLKLDPSKNVIENIMDGLGETRDLLKRFEEISMRFAEPMTDDEMNALIEEQGELQEKIDACNGWDLERNVKIAMDAAKRHGIPAITPLLDYLDEDFLKETIRKAYNI